MPGQKEELWVVPEQLRKARETLGLSLPEAAARIGVSPEDLASWEHGGGGPDDEQLWNLAESYGRPLDYFFAVTPRPPDRQDFRLDTARRATTPDDRRVVVAEFEELCRAQTALERLLGISDGSRLESVRAQGGELRDAELLAEFVRKSFGIPPGPTRDFRDALEAWGIRVFLADMPDSMSGTSWWHPTYGPAMLVNRSEVAGRRLFTMAHELAHLLRSDGQVICDLNFEVAEEQFANEFAASLLIPASDLRQYARPLLAAEELGGWATTDATLDRAAARYKTSREATAWRLERLGMLPAGFTKARLQEWLTRPRPFFRGPKGPRWRRRLGDLGRRHATMAREAYEKGAVSLSALADILRVDVTQADQWLASEEDD